MKIKTIELDISVRYLDLITIFFKANGLTDLGITLTVEDIIYKIPVNIVSNRPDTADREYISEQTRKTIVCTYDEDNEEQAGKIMFMSFTHLGFNNMLHDFLNKCGIPPQQHKQ